MFVLIERDCTRTEVSPIWSVIIPLCYGLESHGGRQRGRRWP